MWSRKKFRIKGEGFYICISLKINKMSLVSQKAVFHKLKGGL